MHRRRSVISPLLAVTFVAVEGVLAAAAFAGCGGLFSAITAEGKRQELSQQLAAGELSSREYIDATSELDRSSGSLANESHRLPTTTQGR